MSNLDNRVRIDPARLQARLAALGEIGALPGGGVCRLAFSEQDREGRDLVVRWMHELGLQVTIDAIGNIVGVRAGRMPGAPVMVGSHIDTVATGGIYDGALGVLAGLEMIAALNAAGIETARPIAVAAFSNEEGARFAPDMMGSLVYVGGMSVEAARATRGIDGSVLGETLDHIGYAGTAPCGRADVHAYVELHIEQGPVLEDAGIPIGVVDGVQGISWTEITFRGTSAHAGTTPMRLRHDAGVAAAEVIVGLRRLAEELGEEQVTTVGALTFAPNLVNVVPNHVVMTADLRNPREERLQIAEQRLGELIRQAASRHGVSAETRSLARFAPVPFDAAITARIEAHAKDLGLATRRMFSGAGHDAQMLARICPAGMIFVPSTGGLSHNIAEFTPARDIENGAALLLRVILDLAGSADAAGGADR
jgi:N-carbamoyl-L-amino-acid hydrolase